MKQHRFGTLFISNIIRYPNFSQYTNKSDPLSDNITDPIIKFIVKYRHHSSVLTIGEVCEGNQQLLFSYLQVYREDFFKQILKLDFSKKCLDFDVSTEVWKEYIDIFTYLHTSLNYPVSNSTFPSILRKEKQMWLRFKKGYRNSKYSPRPVVYYQICNHI